MGRRQIAGQRIKRGRDEVWRREKSSQNKMALLQTEIRRHVQETSQGQLYHLAVGFPLNSLFPAQCLTPLSTTPGFPKCGASLVHCSLRNTFCLFQGRRESGGPLYRHSTNLFSALCHISTFHSTWWPHSGAFRAVNKACFPLIYSPKSIQVP